MNHTSPATAASLTIVKADGPSLDLIPKTTSASSSQRAKASSAAAASSTSYSSLPSRIVYGPGAITRLPTELGYLHLSRPLIVASSSRASVVRHVQALIPNLDASIFDSPTFNVSPQVVDDATKRFSRVDCVISVGGSSAVGLARAVSVRKSIPHICIPTVSNATDMLSLSEHDALIESAKSNYDTSHHGTPSRREGAGKRSDNSRTSGSRSSGTKSSGSRASSRRSAAGRPAQSLSKPAVIIYDEELTAIHARRLSAPTGPRTAPLSSNDTKTDASGFSFIQLPGL